MLENNLHSFSLPRFSLSLFSSVSLSLSLSVFLSLFLSHLITPSFLDACPLFFSHPESVLLSPTFKNSTSHSDFTRLLSCLHCLSAPVCFSTPLPHFAHLSIQPSPILCWFLSLKALLSIHLYLSYHDISFLLFTFAISFLFLLYSSPSTRLSLPSFLCPYLVSWLILHPSTFCFSLAISFFCLLYLTTFLSVKPQLSSATFYLLYISVPYSRLPFLYPICPLFPCGLLFCDPVSASIP